MKTAILFSGTPYAFRFSLASLMANLIEPNDADVFVLFPRNGSIRRASDGFPNHDGPRALHLTDSEWEDHSRRTERVPYVVSQDDVAFMRSAFGRRLRRLEMCEDIPGYDDGLRTARRRVADAARQYMRNGGVIGTPSEGGDEYNSMCDQYYHVRKCYGLMEEEEARVGARYDRVVRARLDFIVDGAITLNPCLDDLLRVAGEVRNSWEQVETADEFFWYSSRAVAARVFPGLERLGCVIDTKYETRDRRDGDAATSYGLESRHDHRFTPEVQWSILLYELDIKPIKARLFRSQRYTKGDDGYYYMNYTLQAYNE